MIGAWRFPMIAGGGVGDPDPAVFCPLHGYLPPYEYFESPIEVAIVSDESIVFILDTYVSPILNSFTVLSDISSAKKFSFYDDAGSLLGEQTSTSNTTYAISQIIPDSTSQYVKCILTLVNASAKFTRFYSTASSVISVGVVAIFCNTPNLISGVTMVGQKSLKLIEFLCTLNYVSSFAQLFMNCSVEKFTMPVSMPALTSMQQALSGAEIKEFIFPEGFSAPLLTTLTALTSSTTKNLKQLLIPDIPSILNMSLMMYLNPVIQSLIITGCRNITNISQITQGNSNILELEFPEFPNTSSSTNVTSICNGMSSVEKITMNGEWNYVGSTPFVNCYKLREIHWPRRINNVAGETFIDNSLQSLLTIHVPDYINASALTWKNYAVLGTGTIANVIKKVYGDFEFASGSAELWYNAGYYDLMLEEINFPKLKVAYVRLGDNGTTYKMRKLTTLVIDWANSPFDHSLPSQAIKIAAPLDTAWIDAMFSALPVVTGGQTCDVRYCDGYAGCDPTIATAKGWTVL